MRIDPGSVSRVCLSNYYLQKTIALVEKRIFPYQFALKESPAANLTASLDPEKYRAELEGQDIRSLEYWISLRGDEPITITGLYQKLSEPKTTAWLGWFGVDPTSRGNGLASQELGWTIERARVENCTLLKLYTSDVENEAAAQKLYEKFGLEVYKTEPAEGITLIYRRRQIG